MLSQKPVAQGTEGQLELFSKAPNNAHSKPLSASEGVPGVSVLLGTLGSVSVPPLDGWWPKTAIKQA